MSLLLCLETASEVCSVAVVLNGKVAGLAEESGGNLHASRLTILVERALKEAGVGLRDLDGVAVSKGPGSYTGLRVGVSSAKGFCYGLGIPLIAIGTLESMAHRYASKYSATGLLIPMLDARRMEVYCSVFNEELQMVEPPSAKIIEPESFGHFEANPKLIFFGNGAAKCEGIITHPGAVFVPGITCSASGMAVLAEAAFANGRFEDTGWFEPYYLKDFAGVKPAKK